MNEPLVLLAETVRGGNADVLEKQRSATDGPLAMAVKAGAREARHIRGHQERSHAVCSGFRRSRTTEDDDGIGLVGRRDRGFLAVDHIVIPDPLYVQAQIGRIGTATGLGQGDRDERVAARQPCQPGIDDIRPSMVRKDLAIERRE